MDQPRLFFSIVTVCFNAPKSDIDVTCSSLQSQVSKDYEHIVIDGGSDEMTLNALEQFSSRFTVFISEPDKGIYDAMNKGIGLANGQYLFFLNMGDSFSSADSLDKVKQAIELDPGSDIYYCNVDHYPAPSSRYPRKISKFWLCNFGLCHQSAFAKRSLFEKIGQFDTNLEISADNDWFVRTLKAKARFSAIPDILTVMPPLGISANLDKGRYGKIQLRTKHFSYWDHLMNTPKLFVYRCYNRLLSRQFHLPPALRSMLRRPRRSK